MTVVLFEPHHDDCAAFSCYSALRDNAFVITVLGDSRVQEQYGISSLTRSVEGEKAFAELDLSHRAWTYNDVRPEWDEIGYEMQNLDSSRLTIDKVWAPMVEDGGHVQHSEVGSLAREVFGDRCHFYATYRRGSGRTRTDNEVTPEPDWPVIKFKAMSCYASQINLANTRPWFAADDMLREWIA